METYLIAGAISLLFTLLLTPWVAVLAKKYGAVQEPPEIVLKKIQEQRERGLSDAEYEAKLQAARRRLDKPPLIMWGGIAYVLPFLIVSGSILLFSKTINLPISEFSTYLLWFVTIGILFAVGILDDVFEFSGKVQFMFHLIAALLFVLSPLDVNGFRNPFGGAYIHTDWWVFTFGNLPWLIRFVFPGDLLFFLWVLPLMNGIKWQGGSDGLMEGNTAIALVMLFLVSFLFNQPASALFAITLAGSLFGFLYYNFYPNKIMSGSAGKSVLGFIVAGIAVIGGSKFAISLIVFAIPLFDMLWVLLRRVVYYRPKSPFQLFLISNKFHFHHQLMKIGYTEKQIAYLQYAITFIFGMLGVFAPPVLKPYILILSWLSVAAIIISTTAKAYEQ
ncbi:MAG: glycosyltransferase family 4 protein [Patescibacteria group bacterium]